MHGPGNELIVYFALLKPFTMHTPFTRYALLIILLVGLGSWGEKAHRKINSSCVDYFPREIRALKTWAPTLADHGSDADKRKKNDPEEFVRHFIDADNYEEFVKQQLIPTDFEAACTRYGRAMVMKNGTLPWVTDSTYHALVDNFKTGSWKQAVLTAADLGHYVGDGFMPLHITANYNGQMSNQTGIHSRYEGEMIDRYIAYVKFKSSGSIPRKEVKPAVTGYLTTNYALMDLLLKADRQALLEAAGQYNDRYYESLWQQTQGFTTRLLEEASRTTAGFIYQAWKEAGKPKIPSRKKLADTN